MRCHTRAVHRSIEIRWQSVYEVQPRIGAQVKTLALRLTRHQVSLWQLSIERNGGLEFAQANP
jgi:hypothetical protein